VATAKGTIIDSSVGEEADVQEALDEVSWDFVDQSPRLALHDIHPWPARFIPDIPRQLIRLLHPKDGSPVLDIFCGCGTTLVEAAVAGLPSVGVDVNPLAALITKVKTTPLQVPLLSAATEVARLGANDPDAIPEIPRVDHWFANDIQIALARLVGAIERVDDEHARDAMQVALSRILVRVSRQESDTRYAAINKRVTGDDVLRLFLDSAESLERALTDAYGGLFPVQPHARVLHADTLQVQPEQVGVGFSLAITSPPYPNAYEYWLYHKYRMYWLGMDPLAAREAEIGARPHYHGANPLDETDFERQMQVCFDLLAKALVSGGLACFVVGRSVIHGRHIDNAALLTRVAGASGFRLTARVDRTIMRSRRSFNLAHAGNGEEAILVFRLTAHSDG
jgi:hypothetical protein